MKVTYVYHQFTHSILFHFTFLLLIGIHKSQTVYSELCKVTFKCEGFIFWKFLGFL